MIDKKERGAALDEMLDARERRAQVQRILLEKYGKCVVSFTLNMPGPVKDGTLARMAFEDGLRQAEAALLSEGISVAQREMIRAVTGSEALLCADADALRVKRLMVAIEENCPIGRFFDLDVLDTDGNKVSRAAAGAPERRCFLCGRPAAECARSRAHGLDALTAHVERALSAYLDARFADETAALAVRAILYELAVTPKPGLVDRKNSGAHRDMDFFSFLASASVLTGYFRECTLSGLAGGEKSAAERFDALCHLGRNAEGDMLRVTGGVNTHKGAVFSLGLLCGARGFLRQTQEEIRTDALCAEAAALCRDACLAHARRTGGLSGARAEAAGGFRTVLETGLPALEAALDGGMDMNGAGVRALLAVMAKAEDTNMLRRGGREALARMRAESEKIDPANAIAFAEEMDAAFIRENLSPGGCADVLAVSFFLLLCR